MEADLALLSRYHRDGDARAFQSLVKAHGSMVFATARRITRDAALAEEVAQDTFLALARQGQAIRDSVAPWLHRVARLKACNARRGEQRRVVHERSAGAELHAEEEAPWSEIEPLVDEVLDAMPDPLRAVVIRHFLERRTQREIARELGLSQPSVCRQIESGLQLLRQGLRHKGVLCGAGLASLMAAGTSEAAPAPLMVSMSKLATAGIGTSAPAAPPASTLITFAAMTTTTKMLLAASASVAALVYVSSLRHAPPAAVEKPKAVAAAPKLPPSSSAEAHHYKPVPVSADIERTVDQIIARHRQMDHGGLAQSKELAELGNRFAELIGTPETQKHLEDALKALAATWGYEHGSINMDFGGGDGLASPIGKAWLEAVVSNSSELAEKWVLNRLDNSTFEFGMDPHAQVSSEGVTIRPRTPKAGESKSKEVPVEE